MNSTESTIASQLKSLKSHKSYIALSLHPPVGSTIIMAEGNRMFINEGRQGKFENVSEAFYDQMVGKYDSRNSK
jgi:hypothetical protein